MGNRMIRESICTSDKIAGLTDFEFRLWIGLITAVDDAGRGDARPAIIKGKVFPLRDRVTVKDIEVALHGLAAKGCVSLYRVGGKPYFWFPTWAEHQRIDRAKPKYPAPEDRDDLQPCAEVCGELRQIAADCGESRAEVETKSNYKSNYKTIKAPAAASALDVAMENFADMRKKIKKPLTDKARELTLAELEKLAPGNEATKVAILEQSIQRCWQGVFPLKDKSAVKNGMKCSYPDNSDLKFMLNELKVEDDLDRLEQQYGGGG